ncbi:MULTISPECIES: multidrug effflux MFS transporter [Niallia]|uniref:multidrug effflux MFS transporter n=1 Tax=Niallia TaxID=2837506 RepID=UPI001EDA2006|nr:MULTISPECIES: multidrug effflux MFS transporter [Niallia]MED4040117.1 multidrug effflux MFS transporter [Niallia taxi]UPO91123.1 multidrug effflux MFS transporter [Niallia sp. Man26]
MSLKSSKYSLVFAILLAVFSAIGPFTIDMYLASFPDMMDFFEAKASMVQASLTSCILGVAFGQIIMGALSDVHGRRKPLLISMIVYALSSFACAFAPNITVFIILRFIQGFSGAAGIVISRAIVRDLYSGIELTKFFSLLTVIGNLAPLIAPLAGSAVISFTSWVGIFIFLGFFGIILSIITTWKIKESLPSEQRVSSNFKGLLRNFKDLLQDRNFMGYALVQGILFSGVFAYISGASFIYQNIYGVTPQVFSMLFALNGISLILGAQVVKFLAGRIKEDSILLIGLVLALMSGTFVLIGVFLHGPLLMLVIPLFLLNAAVGITGPTSFTLAMDSQGHIAGSAAALLGVMPTLLGAVTSPLVGIEGEYSAVPFGVIIFTTSLLSVFAYVAITKNTKSHMFPRKFS